jgi:phage shock protein C
MNRHGQFFVSCFNWIGDMYCTQCGEKLAESARFCTACGKPTGATVSAAAYSAAGFSGSTQPKRLRRILAGKKIAGVCAGFAEYFGADITLMRIIWVALLLLPPHIGLFAYIVAWAVLPKS